MSSAGAGRVERVWGGARELARTWRVHACCCVVPLRAGLLALGYLNVALALILMMGVSSGAEMFQPMVARVQAELLDDEPSAAMCVLAPAADLVANTVLLLAIYKNDTVLLKVYIYYSLLAIAASVVVYSIVIALINLLYLIVISLSLLYQLYVIILVRSLRMEIKLQTCIDSNSVIYHKQNELVLIANTKKEVPQDTAIEIVNEKGKLSASTSNTLSKSSTLKSSETSTSSDKTGTKDTTKDEATKINGKSPEKETAAPAVKPLQQDASVSVTPLDILASKSFHSTIQKDTGNRDLTKEPTKEDSSKTNVKEKEGKLEKVTEETSTEANVENEPSTDAKEEIPQKKKRGIFKRSPKTKDADKKSSKTEK